MGWPSSPNEASKAVEFSATAFARLSDSSTHYAGPKLAAAHGDANFVPSQYMEYDQAVALGKRILEEQAAPKPSLGDIARSFRLRASQSVKRPGTLVLLQDNQGKLLICRGSSTNCRTSA